MKNIREKWEIYLQNPLNFSLISLKILHDFSWESLGILLKIRRCFISYESTKNPYEFCRESPKNPWRINTEISPQFPVDSRFTHYPNFSRDSPPLRIHHPQGFPAESGWICLLGVRHYCNYWEQSSKFPAESVTIIEYWVVPSFCRADSYQIS